MPIKYTNLLHCKDHPNCDLRFENIHIICQPWGPFLTSPLAPRGDICPLGVKFTPLFTPRSEHSVLFRRMEVQKEISPPRDNFTPRGLIHPPRDNFTPRGLIHPWGTTSPLGVNFTPGGQLHPWGSTSPLGVNFTPGGQLHPWGSKFAPRGEVKNEPLHWSWNGSLTFSDESFSIYFWDETSATAKETVCYSHNPGSTSFFLNEAQSINCFVTHAHTIHPHKNIPPTKNPFFNYI
jgi:hypothetical protein